MHDANRVGETRPLSTLKCEIGHAELVNAPHALKFDGIN
jgi:hypothetical protein